MREIATDIRFKRHPIKFIPKQIITHQNWARRKYKFLSFSRVHNISKRHWRECVIRMSLGDMFYVFTLDAACLKNAADHPLGGTSVSACSFQFHHLSTCRGIPILNRGCVFSTAEQTNKLPMRFPLRATN